MCISILWSSAWQRRDGICIFSGWGWTREVYGCHHVPELCKVIIGWGYYVIFIYLSSMDETMYSHGGKYRIGEVCIECVRTVYNIEFNMSGNIRT